MKFAQDNGDNLNTRTEIIKISSFSTMDEQNNQVILDVFQEIIYLYSQDDSGIIYGEKFIKIQGTQEDVGQLDENKFMTHSGRALKRI